jgi:site-specific DNA recombinase
MKKAAIYVRVSTGKQAASDLSLPDQERQCSLFATAQGYEVVEVFVDAGLSARTDKRPEFQRMINLACAAHRPFDAILVHSQSRFARNTKDLLVYKEKLEGNGVTLISITQDLGDGETADVLRTMVGALDEYQSKETAKHVSRSMIENAKQAFWNGSKPPYGYKTYAAETRGARIKKKLEIDEHEAEIIRLIFRLYVFGTGDSGPMGVKQITTHLNEEGYRNRLQKPFRLQYISEILRNTAYVGEHYYNKRDSRLQINRPRSDWILVPVPRIVEDAIFYHVQEKLDRQHPLKTPPRLVKSDILLTSVAKCGECDAPMRKQSGKYGRYHYYRCSKKCDSGKTACKGVSIPMAELDDIVLTTLEDTVLAPKRLCKMTQALVARASEKNEALNARRKKLDGEKRKTVKSLNELYDRIGAGTVAFDATLQQHLKGLQERAETLKRQITYIDQERSLPIRCVSDEKVEAFGDAVKSVLRNRDNPAFARAYIETIVCEVVVTDDEVRVKGPNAALMQQTTAFTTTGELVPAFAQQWRTRQDSNL